mmetsp:Transcript_34330/g.60105  ORF Transcript_34330/g.60105 Transcript_34330/m.60105 type:complete len:243 (-) Transcript_34330:26-754(-)
MLGRVLARSLSTKRVAVVLSGSGVYDGTEITEAVSVILNLSKAKVLYQCYAPNIPQAHVINHLTGSTQAEERNVLVESARIARGNVKEIRELVPDHYDALIIPGGFGAAKNLSTYALTGAEMTVDSVLTEVIESFYRRNKPIGATCIAPIILAKVLGSRSGFQGVELTLGKSREDPDWPYSSAIKIAENFGNKHVNKDVDEVHIDTLANIVTTPAYMKGTAAPHEVYEGIEKLVAEVIRLVK